MLTALLIGMAALPSAVAQNTGGDTQALLYFRNAAETYVRFKFTSPPSRDMVSLADALQTTLDKLLNENGAILKSISNGEDQELREILVGYSSVLTSLSRSEQATDDELAKTDPDFKKMPALMTQVFEYRNKLPKSFDKIRECFSGKIVGSFRDRLSAPAYYLLISPLIKSEGDL